MEKNSKKKTVLIPLDGSDFSASIVEVIAELFDASSYQLCLLQVAEAPRSTSSLFTKAQNGWGVLLDSAYLDSNSPLAGLSAGEAAWLEQALSEKLKKQLSLLNRKLSKAEFNTTIFIRFGNVTEQIKACIHEQNISFVAMATHARTLVEQALLGSIAKEVLVQTGVPVLMFKPKPRLAEESLSVGTRAFAKVNVS